MSGKSNQNQLIPIDTFCSIENDSEDCFAFNHMKSYIISSSNESQIIWTSGCDGNIYLSNLPISPHSKPINIRKNSKTDPFIVLFPELENPNPKVDYKSKHVQFSQPDHDARSTQHLVLRVQSYFIRLEVVHMINGIIPGEAIVLGTLCKYEYTKTPRMRYHQGTVKRIGNGDCDARRAFWFVTNTKKIKFDINKAYTDIYERVANEIVCFHSAKSKCLQYKQWIFISGGTGKRYRNLLSIFYIDYEVVEKKSENNTKKETCKSVQFPRYITSFRINKGFTDENDKKKYMRFINHKFLIKSVCAADNVVELLLFASLSAVSFADSIVKVTVDLSKIEPLADTKENYNNVSYKCERMNICGVGSNELSIKKPQHPLFDSKDWESGKLKHFNSFVFRNNGRYLVIIGGEWSGSYGVSNSVLIFDFVQREWIINDDILNDHIFDYRSIQHNNNENTYIRILGGLNQHYASMGNHWKLFLIRPMPWIVERLVWIAFYQNDDNEQCLIGYLQKILSEQLFSGHNGQSLIKLTVFEKNSSDKARKKR